MDREFDRERRRASRAAAVAERARAKRAKRAAQIRLRLSDSRAKLSATFAKARAEDSEVRRLAALLAEVEGRELPPQTRPAGPAPELTVPKDPPRAANHPSGDLAELLERVRLDVLGRARGDSGDRRMQVRRCVVLLANARGVAETRGALHLLAVEALAWEYVLRGGGRELGAAKDAAA